MQRGPNPLSHYCQADKHDRGDYGPHNFEAIVSVRVGRALRTGAVAIFPNDPTQTDLRRREGNTDDYDRDHELAVDSRPVFRDGFRKPPSSADEHPDRGDRYNPDGYSKKASHQLSPSLVNGEW